MKNATVPGLLLRHAPALAQWYVLLDETGRVVDLVHAGVAVI